MKKVLITGANSYIGMSFEKYVREHYSSELTIATLDMLSDSWRNANFSEYDIVYHVAGIAHADIDYVSENTKTKYYAVNRDLALETCKKAKNEGVKQFVFMSSAIIYGDSAPYGISKRITKETEPNPSNFYGDSKWQADKGVREMQDDTFAVTVLRPPMIYGKGSKGNYPKLARMARVFPVFPNVTNERSMLYIENLCEFLSQVMIRGKNGVFWPQNAEYVKTSELVRIIAEVNGHRLHISNACNGVVYIASKVSGRIGNLTNKAFGNMSYDQSMSQYDFDYIVATLRESIERTER